VEIVKVLKFLSRMRKQKIPRALREQVWLTYVGKKFDSKCFVGWCGNIISAFNFEVGHNIPESKGGTLNIDNLRPICTKCNRSMGNMYSIDEFSELSVSTSCFRFWKKKVVF
jgi:5-methylcytosine-specific restriction endonuclease McrA